MKQRNRKALSWLLTLSMMLSLVPALGTTARAADAVSYVYYTVSGTTATKHEDGICETYTSVGNGTATWSEGWYVVNADVTISGYIGVSGTVNLILCDGATLTASAGITTTGATLNIYGQSGGTGTLTATGGEYSAGIGGGGEDEAGGTITIHGGTVNATGGKFSAGIGGGGGEAGDDVGGNVTIYGGTVTAGGGEEGDGACCGTGIGRGGYDEYYVEENEEPGSGTVTIGTGMTVKAGSSEADATRVTTDSFATNHNYKWVQMYASIPATSVTLSNSTPSLYPGDSKTLTYTVDPVNATDLVWSSSAATIATVDANGVVTGVAPGTATITVAGSTDGVSATCAVTVLPVPVESVSLDKETFTLPVGETETLTAAVSPENATYKTVTWTSSDESVATVDADGVVTAVGEGTATITATAANGTDDTTDDKTATCTVTVPASVPYLAWDDSAKELKQQSITPESYTEVTNGDTAWGEADTETWYVVNGTITNGNRITVSGTVNLILCDGATLTASAGITTTGATLNIYGQSGGTGTLTANAGNQAAGIGGESDKAGGTVAIHGGKVTATGGNQAAGIGGGFYGGGGTVTIYGGTVTATGADNAAGIGGGYHAAGGTVTVHGGTVTANGGAGSAGIGGGSNGGGSGGTVVINGGTVTATGGYGGAGIGGGTGAIGGEVTINGGTVTTTGVGGYFQGDDYGCGAGIGGGGAGPNAGSTGGAGGTVTINGGTVIAAGGNHSNYGCGAGIGGGGADSGRGNGGAGATVTINGGTVTATGGDRAAGIGGGSAGFKNGASSGDAGAPGTVILSGVAVKAGDDSDSAVIVEDYESNHSQRYAQTVVPTPVTSVTLGGGQDSVALAKGETVTLTATVAPDDATYKTVTWTSSDDNVATVENGVVTAVGGGTATITAAAGGKSATCAVTVNVPMTGVSLNETSATLNRGDTLQLTPSFTPADATNKNVTWSSGNDNVATVDENGIVTAVAAGDATITVTTEDGGKTATCDVTVVVPVSGVTLDQTDISLAEYKTATLTATVAPTDATDKTVTWASSDASVATVDANGVVTGVSPGTATITVTATNGTEDTSDDQTATCAVTVNGAVSTYTIIIPATLTVQNAGWNELSAGIRVTGTLIDNDLRKDRLTVTATSANNWALAQQNGSATIGYTMRNAADGDETTFWEFTSLSATEAETRTLGVDVDDYNNAPIGHYTDTVTFTAAVIRTYRVSFNTMGYGTTSTLDTQYVAAGEAPELTTLEPKETETLDFAGWYKDQACTQKWSDSDTVTGPMTLYAKWTDEQLKTLTIRHTFTKFSNRVGEKPCVFTIKYYRNDTWETVYKGSWERWESTDSGSDIVYNNDNVVRLRYCYDRDSGDFEDGEDLEEERELTYVGGNSVGINDKVADFVADRGSNVQY